MILSLVFANDTSMPPPDIITRITGPVDAFATAVIRSCCCPGRRMSTLSRLSASIDRSAPITSTVASAAAAIFLASSTWAVLQATFEQPGRYVVATKAASPCKGVVYLQGVPKSYQNTSFNKLI